MSKRARTKPDAASVLVDGPWEHRFVAANGARFHVAELGHSSSSPVLLIHGFPQFWWAWRHQMQAIADAGMQAIAVDLRGYGASDKPPRGYDMWTLARDMASVIRALGHEQAVVIGHGIGGLIAWTIAGHHPEQVRALATVAMAYPRVFRRHTFTKVGQLRANSYIAGLQRPFVPEREMTEDTGYIHRLLREWASPAGVWPSLPEAHRYSDAVRIPFVAHSAAEMYRWLGRTQLRWTGQRYITSVSTPVDVPVLAIQGADDRTVLPSALEPSLRFAAGPREGVLLPGVGHFALEECPDAVSETITTWLRTLPPLAR